jgi:hypothetical protein
MLTLLREEGELCSDMYDGEGDPAFYGSSHDVYAFTGSPEDALEQAQMEFGNAEIVELRADGHIHVLRF